MVEKMEVAPNKEGTSFLSLGIEEGFFFKKM